MAKVWITYAWKDNEDGDVDFIAQELGNCGLEVKLDRWYIKAGERLWEQIELFIQDKNESDAWVIYATSNSLGSERCKEEYAYALDRALQTRGSTFPVIGLFSGPVDQDLIPAGIRSRLYVSTTDTNWKERIKAAAEGRTPAITRPTLDPYSINIYSVRGGYLIEVRPRAGVWYPFSIAVPLDEKEKVAGPNPIYVLGAPSNPPRLSGGLILQWDGVGESTGHDGTKWWMMSPSCDVTPAKSFYLFARDIPSIIAFGPRIGPLFTYRLLPLERPPISA